MQLFISSNAKQMNFIIWTFFIESIIIESSGGPLFFWFNMVHESRIKCVCMIACVHIWENVKLTVLLMSQITHVRTLG